ncbi:DgyrCDS5105 [Dimorphilus gyrociliatus]|uniref:DgyrCDS5105 n=1 Tax=Dimorphilus gyrociliatus TaxID=2664684 RepID=A0A7I8VL67_9ANNE|nr:DgyrCDS5105 [Dimorphilus gyrociliatus]
MPVAQTRLQVMQVTKLLQCVRDGDKEQIGKLCANGVPHLINYNEPNAGDTALSTAAVANKDNLISYLLELGAHPDVVDFQGRTPAMRAAEYGHVQCLERLLKPGGDAPEKKKRKGDDDDDEHFAIAADMTFKDLEGKGILWYCINSTQRHETCAELALKFAAETNNVDKNGNHVFVHACETASENEEICIKMLQSGSDANSKNEKSNRTALMAASKSGSQRVVRAILERGGEVDVQMLKLKVTAAHEAARGGFFQCLVTLHAYGAHFDVYDDRGNSPMHLAALKGSGPCCKYLAQRGCNPKPKNNEGNTARIIAKEEGHKEAIKEVRKGEKIFGKTGKNNDPWILALYDFCVERTEQLTDLYNRLDVDGHGTVAKEDFVDGLENIGAPMPLEADMKKILQSHDKEGRVDFNLFLTGKKYVNKQYLMSAFEPKKKKKKGKGKGKKGKTKIPLPICTQTEGPRTLGGGPPEVFVEEHLVHTDVGRFDRDRPPKHPLQDDSAWYLHKPDKAHMNIIQATVHRHYDTVQDALSKGVPVDITDKYYKTPLMVACQNGDLDMARWLIEKGANVNAFDNFKWTPLHFACHSGKKDLVEFLLDNGANLESTSLCGATPIMRAIESCRPGLVQFLIDRGAKMLNVTKHDDNVCDIAASFGDMRVYDIVKEKYDSVPKPKDNKKKGGKKSAPAKRPASNAGQAGKVTFP